MVAIMYQFSIKETKISINGTRYVLSFVYTKKHPLSCTRIAPQPLMGAASLEPNYSPNLGRRDSVPGRPRRTNRIFRRAS